MAYDPFMLFMTLAFLRVWILQALTKGVKGTRLPQHDVPPIRDQPFVGGGSKILEALFWIGFVIEV